MNALNPAMGGPGFRDFKYTEAYAPIYDYVAIDTPEMSRRSIYRFVVRTTPQEFAQFIGAEIEKWGRVVKTSGAKVD